MKFKSLALTSAAAALAFAPVAAQAAPTQRASAPAAEASELDGTSWLLPVAAIIAIVIGIILVANDDSVSP